MMYTILVPLDGSPLAEQALPMGLAADWNQALMDYGALVQKAIPRRTGEKSERFETTNRFWRGRIVDALREHHALSMERLLDVLPYSDRDEARVRELVRALHEEGMVEYDVKGDAVRLPE